MKTPAPTMTAAAGRGLELRGGCRHL